MMIQYHTRLFPLNAKNIMYINDFDFLINIQVNTLFLKHQVLLIIAELHNASSYANKLWKVSFSRKVITASTWLTKIERAFLPDVPMHP
jgi:hypothetical protein